MVVTATGGSGTSLLDTLKHKKQTTERIARILKEALQLGNKRPVWIGRVIRDHSSTCVMLEDKRQVELKKNTAFLECNEGGQLVTLEGLANPPKHGSMVVVIPTSAKRDCTRVAYWGFVDDLEDLNDEQTAIGSGQQSQESSKMTKVVPDTRTSWKITARVPRRKKGDIQALIRKVS